MKLTGCEILVGILDDAGVRYAIASADFANRPKQTEWIRKGGMAVLSFWSEHHPEGPLHIFLPEPFAFEEEFDDALKLPESIPVISPSEDKPIDWSLTTWEGAEREQLRRWAELSLREILLAQEEMRILAEKLAPKAP